MANKEQVTAILTALPQVMHQAGEWSEVAIDPQALKSRQPFCLDTMNFSQWLQFVFIPKMQVLLDANQALPRFAHGQGIEPMASEFYNNTEVGKEILTLIRQLDNELHD